MIAFAQLARNRLKGVFAFCSKSSPEQSNSDEQYEKQAQKMKIEKHGTYIGSILTHVESQRFRTHFQIKRYVHSHAWCCLHMWMLNNRSRLLNCRPSQIILGVLFRGGLKVEMERFNYSQIDNFSDRKDRQVYYELKRIQNVTFFGMEDYFAYNFRQKPLSQIICEDMGLYLGQNLTKEDEENISRIEEYITNNIEHLQQSALLPLAKGQLTWKLQ